jgi:BRCA1-associated protein
MPTYFYHIALELFKDPKNAPRAKNSSAPTTSERTVNALAPFTNRYRSPGRHHTSPLDTNFFPRLTAPRQSQHETSSTNESNLKAATALRLPTSHTSDNEVDLLPGAQCSSLEDPRLENIFIESIDMVSPDSIGAKPKKHNDGNISTGIGSHVGGAATKGKYLPLDHKDLESIWGIVHLYRDAEETPSLDDEGRHSKSLRGRHSGLQKSTASLESSVPDEECTTLCILAVPSYLSPSDFLGFVGEQTREEVSHFRMIRTSRANRYMVLMKFRSGRKAREWRREWNGKVFNSMEVSRGFR